MTEPTKEQIQKFWQWCGFWFDGTFWVYGEQTADKMFLHIPNIDLNNLFKYAVPKLIPLDGTAQGGVEFRIYPGGIYCILTLQDKAGFNDIEYFLEGKFDPALALFWAISEVINA